MRDTTNNLQDTQRGAMERIAGLEESYGILRSDLLYLSYRELEHHTQLKEDIRRLEEDITNRVLEGLRNLYQDGDINPTNATDKDSEGEERPSQ